MLCIANAGERIDELKKILEREKDRGVERWKGGKQRIVEEERVMSSDFGILNSLFVIHNS